MCCRSAPRSVHRASAIGAGPLQTPGSRWHTQCLGNGKSLGNCKRQQADRRPQTAASKSRHTMLMPACSCPPGTTAPEQHPSTAAPQPYSIGLPGLQCQRRVAHLVSSGHASTNAPTDHRQSIHFGPHLVAARPWSLFRQATTDNPIHPGTPPGPLGRFSSHAMFLASVIPWPPPHCLACHARHNVANPSHPLRPLSICKSATCPATHPPTSSSSIPTCAHAAALAGTQTQDTTMPSLAE
jgi:hypothetical protein